MMSIKSSTYTSVTRERNSDDEWDADDLSNSTHFIGIQIVEDEKKFFDS